MDRCNEKYNFPSVHEIDDKKWWGSPVIWFGLICWIRGTSYHLIKFDGWFELTVLPNIVQADLVICGLFICEFAYMRLGNGDLNFLYANFWVLLPRLYAFLIKKWYFLIKFLKNLMKFQSCCQKLRWENWICLWL